MKRAALAALDNAVLGTLAFRDQEEAMQEHAHRGRRMLESGDFGKYAEYLPALEKLLKGARSALRWYGAASEYYGGEPLSCEPEALRALDACLKELGARL